jgi:phosphoribosylamine--glycine ligase
MLQEMVDGMEIGVSTYFGPGGFVRAKEESWEHKKFLTGDLGQNTGEMGTVIRYTKESKLFDEVLAPIEDYLHLCNFIGDAGVNCIISDGRPWPLEFTLRLGWPATCLQQAALRTDLIEWMADLIYGRDSFKVTSDPIVGVVMTHGDFPQESDPAHDWSKYPITGISSRNERYIHWQQVMDGKMSVMKNKKLNEIPAMCTAGQYVCVVTGCGPTIIDAKAEAYRTVRELSWPSNIMYRLDIGDCLEEELPKLQKWGYAEGIEYD